MWVRTRAFLTRHRTHYLPELLFRIGSVGIHTRQKGLSSDKEWLYTFVIRRGTVWQRIAKVTLYQNVMVDRCWNWLNIVIDDILISSTSLFKVLVL